MKNILTRILNLVPPIFNSQSFDRQVIDYWQEIFLKESSISRKSISAIYRVKNGGSTLHLAVASIAPLVNEIILVDNNSNDNTREVMEEIKSNLNGIINVKIYQYCNEIARYGPGYSKSLECNPNLSIAKYYNYAYSKATSKYYLKADAGCIFFPDAIKALGANVQANIPIIRFRGMELYGQLMPYEPSLISRDEYNGFEDGKEFEFVSLRHPWRKYSPRGILLRPAFIQIKRISNNFKLLYEKIN